MNIDMTFSQTARYCSAVICTVKQGYLIQRGLDMNYERAENEEELAPEANFVNAHLGICLNALEGVLQILSENDVVGYLSDTPGTPKVFWH